MRFLLFISFVFVLTNGNAQTSAATQRMTGIQLQLFQPGLLVYHEQPLFAAVVLRAEIGLLAGYGRRTSAGEQSTRSYGLNAFATVSPRLYYNLNTYQERRRSTTRNAANFLSLRTTWSPGWGWVSNTNGFALTQGVTVLPTWGVSRTAGPLRWEVSAGVGYRYTAPKGDRKTSGGAIDLRFAIGF